MDKQIKDSIFLDIMFLLSQIAFVISVISIIGWITVKVIKFII